jgi:hypothetical protein
MKVSILVKAGFIILLLIAVGHLIEVITFLYPNNISNAIEAVPVYSYVINFLGIILPLVACYVLWIDFPFAKHIVAATLILDVTNSLYSSVILYKASEGEWGFNLMIRFSLYAVVFCLYLYFLYKEKSKSI